MTLFDDFERKDLDSASYSEASFGYLNRSARPLFIEIRKFLEDWFAKYPSFHQNELRSQFRSDNNIQFEGAFFELLLHEMLLKLKCKVSIHPKVYGTDRAPDFLAEPLNSHSSDFFLEATVVNFLSSADMAEEARLNNIYDILNRYVDASNFFIDVKVGKGPKSQPPAKRIASFLNEKLKEIDPDEIALLYEKDYDLIPQWTFRYDEWNIVFRPVPRKPSARGKQNSMSLGMFSGEMKQVDHITPLRDAILDKAGSYGELEKPYVIAVNAMEPIDDYVVMSALFGQEQYTYYLHEESHPEIPDRKVSRKLDGVWINYSGPKNTRVSAVLVVHHLRPWSISGADIRLYHNPWASKPYTSVINCLPQAVPNKNTNHMEMIDGISLADVLDLPKIEFSD